MISSDWCCAQHLNTVKYKMNYSLIVCQALADSSCVSSALCWQYHIMSSRGRSTRSSINNCSTFDHQTVLFLHQNNSNGSSQIELCGGSFLQRLPAFIEVKTVTSVESQSLSPSDRLESRPVMNVDRTLMTI